MVKQPGPHFRELHRKIFPIFKRRAFWRYNISGEESAKKYKDIRSKNLTGNSLEHLGRKFLGWFIYSSDIHLSRQIDGRSRPRCSRESSRPKTLPASVPRIFHGIDRTLPAFQALWKAIKRPKKIGKTFLVFREKSNCWTPAILQEPCERGSRSPGFAQLSRSVCIKSD